MLAPLLLQRLDTETIGEGALFLIVGGLFMLGLVVALVVLRSIFPSGTPSRGLQQDQLERKIVPTPDLKPYAEPAKPQPLDPAKLTEGQKEALRLRPPHLEAALDIMVQRGWGHPRLLRHLDDQTILRLHECADCKDGNGAPGGCAFQAGYIWGVVRLLEGAKARIAETRCRRSGAPVCEFEVSS